MRTKMDEYAENSMIGLSLLGGEAEPDLEGLEESVEEFLEMLQSKNPAKDDLFAGLPRVKAEIIIEAIFLVKSELWGEIKALASSQAHED